MISLANYYMKLFSLCNEERTYHLHKKFRVWKKFIGHIYTIAQQVNCDKIVFYTDKTEADDIWKNDYKRQLQIGNDLGEKMINAFIYIFKNSYSKAVIIGCDCPELTGQIINEAFELLDNCNVVIGPAADSGYYLLGMKSVHE